MFFGNSRIRFFKIIWLHCEQYGNNQYKHNQYSSVFKVLRWLSNFTDLLIIPIIFIFYLVMKRLTRTKNSVVKIQNFVVNHESWPVKSNPVI